MNAEEAALLSATLRDAARDAVARDQSTFDDELWRTFLSIGLPRMGLPVELGGEGADATAILPAIESIYRYPILVPAADMALCASQTCARLRVQMPPGVVVAASGPLELIDGTTESPRLRGVLHRVAWGRHADAVVIVDPVPGGLPLIALASRDDTSVREGTNLAGEPCDDLVIEDLAATPHPCAVEAARELQMWGALSRAAQICGALASALELSVHHARTRHQFGQPLASFQAIQHHLAALAGEVVTTRAALDVAVQLIDTDLGKLEIAAALAKSRAGEAAGVGARIAHQIHGALGFTREHGLQLYTRRLWSWRDEFGTERYWQTRIGELVPGDTLWATMTSVP